jgi:hypothetical protein
MYVEKPRMLKHDHVLIGEFWLRGIPSSKTFTHMAHVTIISCFNEEAPTNRLQQTSPKEQVHAIPSLWGIAIFLFSSIISHLTSKHFFCWCVTNDLCQSGIEGFSPERWLKLCSGQAPEATRVNILNVFLVCFIPRYTYIHVKYLWTKL